MKNEVEVTRYNPQYDVGLSKEQVKERQENKLNNKTKLVVGKSYAEIIFTNVLSFFNITLFAIAAVMIINGLYKNLFFLTVLIPNIVIGLVQDIKSRVLMGKLKLMTSPTVMVVRDGKKETIKSPDVLLDDIIILKSSNQIPVDGIILEGSVTVNESLLTGESDNIVKNVGDTVLSGSYVVSGQCYIRADKIGESSYASTLSNKARKFRRSNSEILKSLKGLFRIIGTVVVGMAIFMIVTFVIQKRDFDSQLIAQITGSLVSMIPSGLYLLTSIALTLAVGSLAKRQAQVQDFYSVEMLARVNLLCVDKTGTITDGSMLVKEVLPVQIGDSETAISQVISNLLNATKDENLTANALNKHFTVAPNKEASEVLPFTSDNKYSAASFGKDTYALGAFENLPISNRDDIKDKVEEYSSKGNRVLVLTKGKGGIKDKKVSGDVEAIALVILEDHIRDNAKDTFAWFNNNKVGVKVISGDNAMAVSEIAKNAGVTNAEKYVSLAGKSLEETYKLANEYTVFGRVTPEQKETLIKAFKDMGKTVAMTGDGVNDILALKRADCSIAMASGADAARNVSHIVLMDNNFDHLPEVVGEGRRVVNNLQRSSSIFLVKTFFAMVLTFVFTLASIITKSDVAYPFSTMNMYPWEILTIGYASFFLALQPNKELIKGKFLENIFKKSTPAALMMICSVFIIFGFHIADRLSWGYFGLDDFRVATYLSALVFNLLSFVVLYRISSPLDKYRKWVLVGIGAGLAVLLGYEALISMKGIHDTWTIIDINFDSISKAGYVIGAATFLTCFFFYIGGCGIYDTLKNRDRKE
ncbi:MAG: HAD-IC family P-type ATPase [Bacilli bacterium]|nr:HAD-IC family P-type ATPase [Bacilli bacterium]